MTKLLFYRGRNMANRDPEIEREVQALRSLLPEYLARKGIDLGQNKKKAFRCVFPNHNDRGRPNCSYNAKNFTVKCFACNQKGDIFDLIGIDQNLHTYTEKVEAVAREFGRPSPYRKRNSSTSATVATRSNVASWAVSDPYPDALPPDLDDALAPQNYSDFRGLESETVVGEPILAVQAAPNVKTHVTEDNRVGVFSEEEARERAKARATIVEARKRIEEAIPYFEGRRISEEVVRRFGIGFVENYKGIRKGVLIPTGETSLVVRNIDPHCDKGVRYRKTSPTRLFNPDALDSTGFVFVVEGEVDAMSLLSSGFEAVGLGSVSNAGLFVDELTKRGFKSSIILALDNDKTGREKEAELAERLDKIGASYFQAPNGEAERWLGKSDANALLCDSSEALVEYLSDVQSKADEIRNARREEYLRLHSLTGTLQKLADIIAGEKQKPIPTGFPLLDETLGGGLFAGLYTLGAITSLGKTSLVMQIADNVAKSGRDVLVFSLEMSQVELVARSLARLTYDIGIEEGTGKVYASTTRQILSKDRTGRDGEILYQALARYDKDYRPHLFIEESVGMTGVEDIRQIVQTHTEIMGIAPIVIVDYLQILAPFDVRATDKQNTDRAVLELKRLSREYSTPVIAISSFNRASGSGEVRLENFKESGAIEYGSDVCLGLFLDESSGVDINERKKNEVRKVVASVLKNRAGETGGQIRYDYNCLFNHYSETKKS